MVLRLSVIVQVSSFKSVCGLRHAVHWLPVEAMERRAEIIEHGGKVAIQCRTTAD
jgi:hypothetical protein